MYYTTPTLHTRTYKQTYKHTHTYDNSQTPPDVVGQYDHSDYLRGRHGGGYPSADSTVGIAVGPVVGGHHQGPYAGGERGRSRSPYYDR
jgi:hypothetical protein